MTYKYKRQYIGVFEEAIGTLSRVARENGLLIAEMTNKIEIILPQELEGKLCPLIGRKLGILHTDILDKEYLIKVIPELEEGTPAAVENSREDEQVSVCRGMA
jgi:hypothetical protein